MVALHYLKYQHDLSDEDVVAVWVKTLIGNSSVVSGLSSIDFRSILRA